MSFTSYLLHFPSLVLLLLMIIGFAFIGVALTYSFRKYMQAKSRELRTENVGEFFGLIGGVYGLLLGFVVVLVWGAYNDTQTNASKEQSLALGFYREIKYFPDSAAAVPLMQSYLAFVHSVIEKEYPEMEAMEPFTLQDRARISEVYRQLGRLNAANSHADRMVEQLNQIALYRSLRELGAYAEIPADIWLPLLLGYLVLMICSLFLNIESIKMHVLVNGLLCAFIGLIIYIILLVNHPFAGSMKIEPQQYRLILQLASGDQ